MVEIIPWKHAKYGYNYYSGEDNNSTLLQIKQN